MLSQARKDYNKNRTPENSNAVSFHGAKMAYHNNHASIMKMRGMKEEPTNPAAQAAQELKNRIAAHKAAKPQPVRKPAAAPAPKSEPSVYDAAQKVKATPQNPAAQELKARIAAHKAGKKVNEEPIDELDMKKIKNAVAAATTSTTSTTTTT